MNKHKEIIKEAVKNMLETNPAVKPKEKEIIVEPDTKPTPERRRKLDPTPDKQTSPKGLKNEEDENLLKQIGKKYRKANKN